MGMWKPLLLETTAGDFLFLSDVSGTMGETEETQLSNQEYIPDSTEYGTVGDDI